MLFSWSFSFSTCPTTKADKFYPSQSCWNIQTRFCIWKQCHLDSIPTFHFKLCFNGLGPIIKNLVNLSLSLSDGIFSSSFKQALVQFFFLKTNLCLLMISTTFAQFQTLTSSLKFSRKLLFPAFCFTFLLTFFNLPIWTFFLLKQLL